MASSGKFLVHLVLKAVGATESVMDSWTFPPAGRVTHGNKVYTLWAYNGNIIGAQKPNKTVCHSTA